MKTIEQYKAAAIYFKPGRIVPNWLLKIVKGDKKQKRRIKFGCPVWVLPCGDRHVIFGATELPEAAPVQMPEPDINTVNHAGQRVIGYKTETVLRLLAQHVNT